MDVKATAKTVRNTPRKVRLVLDLIRGKSVDEALAILKFTPNQSAEAVYKVVMRQTTSSLMRISCTSRNATQMKVSSSSVSCLVQKVPQVRF